MKLRKCCKNNAEYINSRIYKPFDNGNTVCLFNFKCKICKKKFLLNFTVIKSLFKSRPIPNEIISVILNDLNDKSVNKIVERINLAIEFFEKNKEFQNLPIDPIPGDDNRAYCQHWGSRNEDIEFGKEIEF